jgi:hypothetical protein
MRKKPLAWLMAALAFWGLTGCVERRLVIRSEPSGAPVWLDEVYLGETPLEHSFAHYGVRRVRVGPVRNEAGRLTHEEVEREAVTESPWYETFPLDFFFEVVYPFRLTDEHALPVFMLPPVPTDPAPHGEERLRELRGQADAFRDRALRTIPEEAEGQ